MTGHETERNESVPDLVVGRGGPPRPPPPAPPGSPSQPAPLSRRDAAIILAFLFGPALVAFVVRLVTSRDPWSPTWQLLLVAVVVLLVAAWFLARWDMLKAAHVAAESIRLRDLEAEVRLLAVALSVAVIAEIVAVASFELWMGVALAGVLLAWILFCFLPPLRRIDTRSSVQVACSPEAAFALVSDPQSWQLWTPELEHVEASEVPVRVGTIVRSRGRSEGSLLEGEDKVVVFDPPWRCGTEVLDVRGTSSDLYEIAATDGGSLVTYTFRAMMPPEAAMLGSALQRRPSAERWRKKMLRIKQLLEGGTPGSV
jgi:hypothetical protein